MLKFLYDGSRHSSVVLSAATIIHLAVQVPSIPSTLFQLFEIETVFVIEMRKG